MTIVTLYALLLRGYPRAFYEQFGAEMLDVFTQRWQARRAGLGVALVFFVHEFGGLLASIAHERQHMTARGRWQFLFRHHFVPLWLFAVSIGVAAVFSLSYWGYITLPASTISQVASVDRFALVQLAPDYALSAIPIHEKPYLITPDFPPSQILSALPNRPVEQTLDRALAEQLAAALASARVMLGNHPQYPEEPVVNPNNCGENCFIPGAQMQPDGTFIIEYPEMAFGGQLPIEAMRRTLTPNDWEYYSYIMPAGYVVQGHDASGAPIVFVALASGMISDDRFIYHELIFAQQAQQLTLRNHMRYAFEIAGMEGFTMPLLTALFFMATMTLWLIILVLAGSVRLVRKRLSPPRALA
jgi:hypothetical protein